MIKLTFFTVYVLTLFKIGLIGAAHKWGGLKMPSPILPTTSKIFHSYLTMMELGTVISYLKKIQKSYEACDKPLEYC